MLFRRIHLLSVIVSIGLCFNYYSVQAYSGMAATVPNSDVLFTENKGQVTDDKGVYRPEVLFTATNGDMKLFITATGISYQLLKTESPAGNETDEVANPNYSERLIKRSATKRSIHRFTFSLIGTNNSPVIRKEAQNIFTENFYLAHCPQGITNVHTYSRLVFENIYPGIDWVIYSKGDGIEYDYVVHPGADASLIKWRIADANNVSLSDNGTMSIQTSLGTVTEHAPVSFSKGKQVATHFVKNENGNMGFALGDYDKTKDLTIDPSVTWSTYYGSITTSEVGYGCAVDAGNNVYMSGYTQSTVGIATSGGFQPNYGGGDYDGFLVKFNSAGARLWATYYGGDSSDFFTAASVDGLGNIYAAGFTRSPTGLGFGGFQNALAGEQNAFVVKFNSSGIRQWST
ncbi:MAG: hypothetical protein ABI378_01605, partial [Chitinophagaceae bacterium]